MQNLSRGRLASLRRLLRNAAVRSAVAASFALFSGFGGLLPSAAAGQTEADAPTLAAGNEAAGTAETVTPATESNEVGANTAPEAVVPPGQEELLAAMLGRGAALPGPCTFVGAGADHAIIRSTYSCPHGTVVFELRHPSNAPGNATHTAQFAIMLHSGAPPDGLTDALASLIRSRESAFTWKWLGTPSKRSSRLNVFLAAAGVLGIAALGWALRRRQRPGA